MMPIRQQPTIPEHNAADAIVQARLQKAEAEKRAKDAAKSAAETAGKSSAKTQGKSAAA